MLLIKETLFEEHFPNVRIYLNGEQNSGEFFRERRQGPSLIHASEKNRQSSMELQTLFRPILSVEAPTVNHEAPKAAKLTPAESEGKVDLGKIICFC